MTCPNSRYAYIELINASDSLIQRVMVAEDSNGMFHGNLFLAELIPEGDYTLRAYTRYMENLGDDFFFKKNIRIRNIQNTDKPAKNANPANSAKSKTRNARNIDFDVSFYPEGGNFIEGVFCRVAFKTLNQKGFSTSISGEIVDSEGNRMAEVATVFAGMGSFSFIPEQGKNYFLKCKNTDGKEKQFSLPDASKNCSLFSYFRNDFHFISLNKSPDFPEKTFYLLVHCKGNALYFAPWNYQREYIRIASNDMPSGILQVVLLDEQMNPVSERLIFNKTNDQAQLAFSTDKSFYKKREKVTSEILVTDPDGNPMTGHVSVAITDDNDIAIDSLHTITDGFLLSSELRGHIEAPGYYLKDDPNAEMALDLLMMIHGWRRYAIPETIWGNYQLPRNGYEFAKELSGTLKTHIFGKPVINGEVMLITDAGNTEQTTTDASGWFRFYHHFPDSTKIMIKATNQKGKDNVLVTMRQETFPKLKHLPAGWSSISNDLKKESQLMNIETGFIKKVEHQARYDDGIRFINLPEVMVTAKKIEKRDEARLSIPYNVNSDKTIYRESFEKRVVLYPHQLLENIAGVQVGNRGGVSIRRQGYAFVYIDGVPMGSAIDSYNSPLNSISVQDIDAIDVFKGPSAAIFGFKGANGVISITTRRGGNINDLDSIHVNFITLSPFGYQNPVEFYAPKYETTEAVNFGVPDYRTTIFWKPNVLVNENGIATFDFYTSDFPTTYSVVFEGLTNDGKIIRQVETIEVR